MYTTHFLAAWQSCDVLWSQECRCTSWLLPARHRWRVQAAGSSCPLDTLQRDFQALWLPCWASKLLFWPCVKPLTVSCCFPQCCHSERRDSLAIWLFLWTLLFVNFILSPRSLLPCSYFVSVLNMFNMNESLWFLKWTETGMSIPGLISIRERWKESNKMIKMTKKQ